MYILNKKFENKFIILSLCFILIFTNVNFSFANDEDIDFLYAPAVVAVAPEIVASIGAFLVASGCSIVSQKMLNDSVRYFYNDNKDNWEEVVETFKKDVKKVGQGLVNIGSGFLAMLSSSFDKLLYQSDTIEDNVVGLYDTIPVVNSLPPSGSGVKEFYSNFGKMLSEGVYGNIKTVSASNGGLSFYNNATNVYLKKVSNNDYYKIQYFIYDSALYYYFWSSMGYPALTKLSDMSFFGGVSDYALDMPTGYNPGKLQTDEEGSVGVGIPNTLDKFIDGTIGYDNIYNPNYDTTVDGSVGVGSMPGVSNPSIEYGDSITIPGTDVSNPSVPGVDTGTNVGIWATITDFVISLVVPSDTFWTDTWNGLYGGFVSAFPGVDMDNFNSLVTGEKKFPNIDINIMGVKGRVVNGDVINSIVDWLRPIIAGFMMLCLMFFNYRKIYKLIRNSEPFGGIAPGTSDFSTGISEYSDNYLKAKEIIGENFRVMTSKGGK